MTTFWECLSKRHVIYEFMLYNILKPKLLYEHTFFSIKSKCVLFTYVHILQINLKWLVKFDHGVLASIIITIMLLLVISEGSALSLFVKVQIYSFYYDKCCNFHYILIYYTFTFPPSFNERTANINLIFYFGNWLHFKDKLALWISRSK